MKRIKLDSSSTTDTVPSTSNDQRQADITTNDQPKTEIFKLKVDHFEELFDWLSLEDIVSLGQTCKRMQRIAGYCFKANYSEIKGEWHGDGFKVSQWPTYNRIDLGQLCSFLKRCAFDGEDDFPHMKREQYKSLTEIAIWYCVLADEKVSSIKEILSQLETVRLQCLEPCDEMEFHGGFLQHCTNVKKLCIEGESNSPIIGTDNSWLLRKYPTIEHFELITHESGSIDELKTFLEQNTNIHKFAASFDIILANRNALENSLAKFEVLSVESLNIKTFNSSLDILNRLYERGFYKQLHLYFPIDSSINSPIDQETANRLTSLKGLTKLFVLCIADGTDLSHLIDLKQLCVHNPDEISMLPLAERLLNLELVELRSAKYDDILQFIRHSPKLNKIVLYCLSWSESKHLNVERLNKERSKLANAKKVSIYVDESVYLEVKWAQNQIDCSLVELKRGASQSGLGHDFDRINESHASF